jgi:hypothetical protein
MSSGYFNVLCKIIDPVILVRVQMVIVIAVMIGIIYIKRIG